ncbi:MAG: T9SS type A sorting domain-containing protein [Candidatus Marinimicrobia bacterium]|nr:T9SS type A sorting domain-containing protein [Candidatus Neomarinimicrobiota bacterium]
MQETDTEGVIPFTLDGLVDARGNPADGFTTTSDGSNVVYDRTKPILNSVQLSSNNDWNQYWAKEGDYGSVYSNSNEDLLTLVCKFNGNTTTDNWYSADEFELGYTFSSTDIEGLVSYEIIYSDSAGNFGDTVLTSTNNTFLIFDKTPPTDFTVGDAASTGGNIVTSYWNSTNTGIDIIVPIESDSTLDSGRVQIWAKVGTNAFEMLGDSSFILSAEVGATKTISIPGESVRAITGYTENDTISFKAFLFDIPGNQKEGTESASKLIIEETQPTLSYISYKSNFTDTTLATVGHEITVTFITSEIIEIPTASISSNSGTVSDLSNNKWSALYIMQESDSDGVIPFVIDTLTDIHGNPAEGGTATTDGSTVIFDNTKPTLTTVSIASDNADTTWAKVGDTLTVKFTGDELLSEQSVTIVTQLATITDLGSENYTAKYTMTETDPEGVVAFEITVTDSVDLVSDPLSETSDETAVIFDRTVPTLTLVHIESNNVYSSLIAIEGDEVYLTFTSQELLIMDSITVTIGSEATTLTESDGTYTATLIMSGDEPEGILDYTLDFKDRAGNPGIQVITTSDGSYVNHDVFPPEIEITSIASNNSDSTWAKVGDTVFVTFSATEVLDNITITIAGESSIYNELSLAKYSAYLVLDESHNEGVIPFLITYTDLGGAVGPDADSTTNNTQVQYDRTIPEFSAARMASNNEYGDSLAGIGTVDTLAFSLSENYRDLSVSLTGIEKTPEEDGLNFSTTHTFSASDTEGWVTFSISMIDSAGNESGALTETQNGSQVRFDGTAPTLPFVTFYSNNNLDSSLCIVGDSLYLQFTVIETLRTFSATIATNGPDQSAYSNGKYTAIYEMTGSETEGFIPFTIFDFVDWVGNIGDPVNTSTNGSTVLFDMTPPADFTVGMVTSKNGMEVTGYWNASNQSLDVIIPVPNDETLPEGGIQLKTSFDGDFYSLGDTVLIEESDINMDITLTVTGTDFESIFGFNENENAIFKADLWDKAGNITTGSASISNLHIDETLPTLTMVNQQTNNAIADSLAKVGDTDTLTFSSIEGLDSITIQIMNQSATWNGSNRDWIGSYTFQNSDNDGSVPFNIVFGDTAGNMGLIVSETTDESSIRFDGTKPTLSSVSFISTNDLDTELAMVGDTLFLDFTSDEILITTEVLIAESTADTTFENEVRTPFRSWRIMDGTEAEGFITFRIVYSDLVGNLGDTVNVTSNETSVLFDMTPPADFELDTVMVSGGTIVYGYWNANNDSIILKAPVPDADETMIGGIFQPQIRFGEGDYINIGDEFLILGELGIPFQELKIPRSVFTSVDGYAEGENAIFIAIARDRAGNETVGTTDNTTIHIDETFPELTDISIYSDNELDTTWAKLGNNVILQFTASEGLSSPSGIILVDTLTLNSTLNGTEWTLTKLLDDEDEEGVISFSISFADTAGNIGNPISETTNGVEVTLDKTNPSISNLLEGENGEDISYYNQSDSITLYWEQYDSLAGVLDGYVALGTDSNSTDIFDWTLSDNGSFSGLGGLNLSNNGIYFGGAFIRDSAGNHSDTIWGNSIYIDTQIPDTGSIIDGYWVMDLDYSIDSTKLSYIWSNFTDNTEIDYYEIAIGTGNDTSNTLDWITSDSTDSMTVTGLNLVRDTLYYTYIKAVDLATNQSISAKTDGIYFDDSFPVVNKITPNVISDSAGFLSVLSNDTITIKFNRPIYTYDLQAQSNVESDFTVSHEYGDSLITVIWENTLSSYDTITVVVDSAMAFNTLVVSDTLKFYSQLWGDLNNDYDITVEDILMFNQNWPATDLGPYTDDPPHVRPNPDGEANLTDLAAFGKMWHWKYFNLDFDTTLFASRSSEGLEIIAQGSKAKISLPKNVAMAEMLIGESNLDVGKMNFMNPSGSAFIFTALDTSQGMKQFSTADYRGFDSTLTLWLPETEQTIFQVQLQYKFLDKDGVELAKGLQSVDIEILPENFTVYDNYPNPFNPVTTIRYELPDIRDVNIVIYDILGREIRKIDLNKVSAGRHQFKWSGTNDFGKRVSTGVYFLQLTAGRNTNIQKMLLLK